MNRQIQVLRLFIIAATVILSTVVSAKAQGNIALQGVEIATVTDGVDIFSGKLEQILPLIKVQGRGGMSETLNLPLRNIEWRVNEGVSLESQGKVYTFYNPAQSNYTQFARAGYATIGRLEVQTRFTGYYFMETPGVTEIKFTSSSGSITHFRDTLTNGQPYDLRARGCSAGLGHPNPEPACSRGRIFRAIDGSNTTFVADADVLDVIGDQVGGSQYKLQSNISGTIFLNNGTRIRIESLFNTVAKITDRNGNFLKFDYITAPGYTQSYLNKITDSLNRQTSL